MERTDLDQWRGREVARLLALVETQRRYYQEIVASVPVGLLVLSSDFNIVLANGVARKVFGLQAGESPRRMDTILPASLLDRIEEVLKTSVPQTGVMVETGRDKRRLRVGILAIRNWDEEAAQEALLAVEDLTGLAVFREAAPPAPEVVVAAPVPFVAEPQAPEVAAIEAVPAIEELPAISAQQLIANIDAIVWAVELPSMNFVFASPQAEKLLGLRPGTLDQPSVVSGWIGYTIPIAIGWPNLTSEPSRRASRIHANSRPSRPEAAVCGCGNMPVCFPLQRPAGRGSRAT